METVPETKVNSVERRQDVRRPAFVTVEWPTIALIGACYASWVAAGLLYGAAPWASVPLLAITIVLHSSLQHEAIHRHPTPSAAWNEVMVGLPLGLLVPYRRYREQHLAHHVDGGLTDPYDDPESYYVAQADWQRLPRMLQHLLAWNNRLVIRMLIGPAITTAVFLWAEAKMLVRPAQHGQRFAWLLHMSGLVAVAAIVRFVFAMPFAAYLLAAYLGLSLLAVRSFCEHQWAEHPGARTVIVEKSMLGPLFLNNNLHVVHHAHPGLSWYALPGAYRARRAEWQRINHCYVFNGYRAVLRRFGLRSKEPVVHPVRVER